MSSEIEIIPQRLFWYSDKYPPYNPNAHVICTDNVISKQTLVYQPYNTDFGPLDQSQIFKFCTLLQDTLSDPDLKTRQVYHYTSTQPSKRANSALLICAYQVLILNRSPEESWSYFENLPRFLLFRDASPEGSSFELQIIDCLRALFRGKYLKWFKIESFKLEEYERFNNPNSGGLNWIVPNKLLAFANPASRSNKKGLTPEQYSDQFEQLGVKAVVRLNKATYDSSKFKKKGLNHYDLFFEDGSVPASDIVLEFFSICERENTLAVHCQAGLGRTATLIACYLIKEFQFTGLEAIAWCRMCRPGSVLGPQQHFLCEFYERTTQRKSEREVTMTPDEVYKAQFGDIGQGYRLTSHSSREGSQRNSLHYKTKFNYLLKVNPNLVKIYNKK